MGANARINWGLVLGIVSLVITLATGGTVFGKLEGRVAQNTEAIREIRADIRTSASMLAQVNERTARIETKLEILLPTAPTKQEAR